MNKIQTIDIGKIKVNPENPRIIRDDKFQKLVKSIKEFPEMLNIRPIILNKKMVIIGGNMRFRAAKEAGMKKIPVLIADLTQDQENEFVIKDNLNYGEWDWDIIANEWDEVKLVDWGVSLPGFDGGEMQSGSLDLSGSGEGGDGRYTRKIEAPVYTPSDKKPDLTELIDLEKYEQLVSDIDSSSVSPEIKKFLKFAATRHVVFDYSKIADFYAHAEKPIQDLMEKSALVIIDFDKAIENGFIELSEEVAEQFKKENDGQEE